MKHYCFKIEILKVCKNIILPHEVKFRQNMGLSPPTDKQTSKNEIQ